MISIFAHTCIREGESSHGNVKNPDVSEKNTAVHLLREGENNGASEN